MLCLADQFIIITFRTIIKNKNESIVNDAIYYDVGKLVNLLTTLNEVNHEFNKINKIRIHHIGVSGEIQNYDYYLFNQFIILFYDV